MIDTHCHLYLPPLSQNPEEVVQRAKTAGVDRMIIVGVDLESSQTALKLADQIPNIYSCVGIHPDVIGPTTENFVVSSLDQFMKLLDNPHVVGVGECGLDYTEIQDGSPDIALRVINQQKRLFGLHIQ